MEVKDTLTLMIQFGILIVSILGLVVTIIVAMNQNKKK
ncbi:putative holin-like toxin [Paenibacillus sp. PsM32]|nr:MULTISPECIES: putative holin-like toxin [unclassified Paenibacillus]MDN4616945.1 putative holin-like toxin [Paenibacillus sp. PsM32]